MWDALSIQNRELKQSKYLFQVIQKQFPREFTLGEHPLLKVIGISPYRVEKLARPLLNECLSILDDNLGPTYAALNGSDWKAAKELEMQESGLIYLLLRDLSTESSDKNKLIGFLSMKIVSDGDDQVIYLYEIQITSEYRNIRLGSLLMKEFLRLPDLVNDNQEFVDKYDYIDGTSLTVFSSNGKAYEFYLRLGYQLAKHSPTDRRLRGGKLVKPQYYILSLLNQL
ncbi:hypothetical protein CANARDRAFT_202643 [[Candida] arabinofermentans NRRL YB-2248]|uniref:N-alpha-acetyltransferase 40 n=1 Tax=[Candida] arabinofermentans NRRL YB-2248 TaxID=983967 RepID=A0A1E4SW52_9ASCO|nr:hypothetical protein CANARDRAFT_202643 [[Candida] arabinofermentans NRRL YB-2248]